MCYGHVYDSFCNCKTFKCDNLLLLELELEKGEGMNWTVIKWIAWITLALAIWPLSIGRFVLATLAAMLYGLAMFNEAFKK